MNRSVFSIIRMTFQTYLKTRFVFWLIVFIVGGCIFFPDIVTDGASVRGMNRMLLCWTLGFSVFMLGVGMLWVSCTSFSSDFDDGRLAGAVLTPTGAFCQWFGRWLGLGVIAGSILIVVYAAVYLNLKFRYGGGMPTEQLLTQTDDSASAAADDLFSEMLLKGGISDDSAMEELRAGIKNRICGSYLPVNPGSARVWKFNAPKGGFSVENKLKVNFSYLASYGGTGSSGDIGKCQVLLPDGTVVGTAVVDDKVGGMFSFETDSGKMSECRYFEVVFTNTQDLAEGSAVLVDHGASVLVYVNNGTVAGNMLRSFLVSFSVLLLLVGMGLAVGMVFSFPVAVFSAAVLVCVVFVGRSEFLPDGEAVMTSHIAAADEKPMLAEMSLKFSRTMSIVIRKATDPIYSAGAFDKLGDGLLIDAGDVLWCFITAGIVMPMIMGAAGAFFLKRREFV